MTQSVSTSPILPAGTQVGEYVLGEVVGIGGMAVVYRARQAGLRREVAVKVLSERFSTDAVVRERFEREGAALASLDHPAVLPVYDAGSSGGHLYLVTRLVGGGNLADRLIRDPLSLAETVHVIETVAEALEAAHAAGLVHRDVKPHNVLLESGRAYLADFGIAGGGGGDLTAVGALLGSVKYAAPEQLRGQSVTPASDVYGLAVIAYECLSGRVPFARDSEAATMNAQLHDPPPPLPGTADGPAEAIGAVLAAGLEKEQTQRTASAREFGRALRAAAETLVPYVGARAPALAEAPPLEPVATADPVVDLLSISSVRSAEPADAGEAEWEALDPTRPRIDPHRGRRRAVRWGAGVVAGGVLIIGGAVAAFGGGAGADGATVLRAGALQVTAPGDWASDASGGIFYGGLSDRHAYVRASDRLRLTLATGSPKEAVSFLRGAEEGGATIRAAGPGEAASRLITSEGLPSHLLVWGADGQVSNT